MEYNYIFLVRKDDVIDFIKYGRLFPNCSYVDFSGDVEALRQDEKLAKKLFDTANEFEYSIEYYLLHICVAKKLSKSKPIAVEIQNLKGIYALNQEAYNVGLSLNPPVQLNAPIWPEKVYDDFQLTIAKNSSLRGITNIGAIFGVEFTKMNRGFIKKNELLQIVEDAYKGVRPSGEKSIWVYLCQYERHHSYPKDTRGFFLDALHAIINYQKKGEIDEPAYNQGLGQDIMSQVPNIKYDELLKVVEGHPKFVKYTEKLFKGLYRIAPLYMLLKATFEDGLDNSKTYFGTSLEKFIGILNNKNFYNRDDLKHALYLIGFQLGWSETYQYYYEVEKFSFLK